MSTNLEKMIQARDAVRSAGNISEALAINEFVGRALADNLEDASNDLLVAFKGDPRIKEISEQMTRIKNGDRSPELIARHRQLLKEMRADIGKPEKS